MIKFSKRHDWTEEQDKYLADHHAYQTIIEMAQALGIELNTGPREAAASLDRVRPEAGYTKGNIRVVSFRANRLKSDATPAELRLVLDYMEGRR